MPDQGSTSKQINNLTPEAWLRLQGLSSREAEATLLAGHGLRIREITEQMKVSEGTVKTHLFRAREKLGCGTIRDIVSLLLREGIVNPQDFLTPRYSDTAYEALRHLAVDKKSTFG